MKDIDVKKERTRQFVNSTIKKFNLRLDDLVVFTEAATGNYQYTPIMAAMAGAKHVYALAKDSNYGTKSKVANDLLEEANHFGIANNISVLFRKDPECIGNSDIITNSGFVRPFTLEMIRSMKPTTVIPLMWETWEFREEEFDLQACREKGVVVLGTNEHHPLLGLFYSNGFMVTKLLLETGFGVYKDNILLISSGLIGDSITDFFSSTGVNFDRVVFDTKIPGHQLKFIRDKKHILDKLDKYDAIVIAELHHDVDILSDTGFIPVSILRRCNPLVQIIQVCGNINKNHIAREGLSIYPEDIKAPGYMTVSPDILGPKTTIELNAAGLKVGEAMARCRLKGMSIKDTIEFTLQNSPAMDF